MLEVTSWTAQQVNNQKGHQCESICIYMILIFYVITIYQDIIVILQLPKVLYWNSAYTHHWPAVL